MSEEHVHSWGYRRRWTYVKELRTIVMEGGRKPYDSSAIKTSRADSRKESSTVPYGVQT